MVVEMDEGKRVVGGLGRGSAEYLVGGRRWRHGEEGGKGGARGTVHAPHNA